MQDAQHQAAHAETDQRYIGDSNAEMLAVEWEGFERGYAHATAQPAAQPADQIVDAACAACEQALTGYIFLNREAFHTAFTHGWIAGSLAAAHGWRPPEQLDR